MNAFVSGALAALTSIRKIFNEQLPEGQIRQTFLDLIDSYIDMYKAMDRPPLTKAKVVEELQKIDEEVKKILEQDAREHGEIPSDEDDDFDNSDHQYDA